MSGFNEPAATGLLVFWSVCSAFAAGWMKYSGNPLQARVRAMLRGRKSFRDRMALWGNTMAEIPAVSRYFGHTGTQKRLKSAGFPLNMTADEFLALKLVLLGLAVLVFMTCLATGKVLPAIFCPAAALPDLVLGQIIKSRHKAMDREFVPMAGRMAAAARAGKSLAESMRWSAGKAQSVLAGEFRWCLAQLEAGIPIEASLDALAAETGLLSIRRMATALINAEKYGTGIADTLATAAADARRRRTDAAAARLEEREGYAVLALVMMILPGVILLLVPMLMQIREVGFF